MSKKELKSIEEVATDLSTMVCLEDDANMGMEEADASSFAIPFLRVLNAISPQVVNEVEGAKAGFFIDTITQEVFKDVLVIPCHYRRKYLRWVFPREGRGYRGQYSPIDIETGKVETEVQENGARMIRGDILEDTREHYVLYKSTNGRWKPAIMSLASSQIKKSKNWMYRIKGLELRSESGKPFNPASFSHVYQVKSVKESKDQYVWYGYDFNMYGPVEDAETYQRAKALHREASRGNVEVKYEDVIEDEQQTKRF